MKVNRYDDIICLDDVGNDMLTYARSLRAFDAEEWLHAKRLLLRNFIAESGRDSVVIGLSGGVDSAVAHAVLCDTFKSTHVFPVNLPISKGKTDQEKGTALARQCDNNVIICDLTKIVDKMSDSLTEALSKSFLHNSVEKTSWSVGQLASCLLSPSLYFIASLLVDEGFSPVVAGTINRSEGSYLGYWGKTSDASVDIQIIADLYKSEVYKVAELLDIPDEIRNAIPKGDVYDGSSDERLFGVTYDALELFTELKVNPNILRHFETMPAHWDEITRRIEAMHSYNAHKYIAPACGVWGNHMNVLEAGCPGGWPMNNKVIDNYPILMHGEFKKKDE